jgi:hypothetical protein
MNTAPQCFYPSGNFLPRDLLRSIEKSDSNFENLA